LPGNEFTVSQKGDVILRKSLDFERIENYSFVVHVTDGRRNDSARVNISILNINDWDPRLLSLKYGYRPVTHRNYVKQAMMAAKVLEKKI
jgi:hypothetical protein